MPYISVKQAANRYLPSATTIRRWARTGAVEARNRFGFWEIEERSLRAHLGVESRTDVIARKVPRGGDLWNCVFTFSSLTGGLAAGIGWGLHEGPIEGVVAAFLFGFLLWPVLALGAFAVVHGAVLLYFTVVVLGGLLFLPFWAIGRVIRTLRAQRR